MRREELPGDASALIYLAKANAFGDARAYVDAILVSPAVWQEAVGAGERIGAPEVGRIKEATNAGLLRRVDLRQDIQQTAHRIAAEHRLGRGESEVLALASGQRRAIVDEGRAARVARVLGITVVSTLFLPVLGRQRGELAAGDAVRLLHRLAVVAGARADVVLTIERHLKEERK